MISNLTKINGGFQKYIAYKMYTARTKNLLMLICGLLSFPLVIYALSLAEQISNMGNTFGHELESLILIIGGLSFFAVAVFALLIYLSGVGYCDYYHKRENVDMSWSLPLTNKQRFWGDFTAGLAPIVICYLVSCVMGLLVFKLAMPSNEYLKMVAALMLVGLIAAVSLYILVVFCACLCGKLSTALIYPAVICVIIPAVIFVISTLTFADVWQVDIGWPLFILVSGTSPSGFLLVSFRWVMDMIYRADAASFSDYLQFLSPPIIIPFIVINAAFLTGAYYISKKRKAEATGKPFVVRYASVILISLLIFCITAAFVMKIRFSDGGAAGYYFGLFSCTLIAFLIFDISANAGKVTSRKVLLMAIRYAAMVVGSLIISWALVFSNGFGIGEYVPDVNKIKSVTIDISVFDGDNIIEGRRFIEDGPHGITERFYDVSSATTFKDKESFEILTAAHAYSNENVDGPTISSDYYWQTITYTLNSGRTVLRHIYIERHNEDMLKLAASADYKRDVIEKLEKLYESADSPALLANIDSFERFATFPNTDENALRLFEAFKLDYMAETFEQKYETTYRNFGVFSFETPRGVDGDYLKADMFIRPHYTNLLEEMERLDMLQLDSSYLDTPLLLIWCLDIFATPKNYRGRATQSYSDSFRYRNQDEQTAELISTLMNVAQPSYLMGEPGYIFSVGDVEYVIPPEYTDMADEVSRIVRWY